MKSENLKFNKSERLTGEIRIKELFEKGSFLLSYPFRIGFLIAAESDVPAKVVISVPKKRFKKAHDRNYIKRLIRESYRLNKALLYELLNKKNCAVHLAVSYISSDKLSHEIIQKKWIKTIDELAKKLPEKV